jgi:hypothetical protein
MAVAISLQVSSVIAESVDMFFLLNKHPGMGSECSVQHFESSLNPYSLLRGLASCYFVHMFSENSNDSVYFLMQWVQSDEVL